MPPPITRPGKAPQHPQLRIYYLFLLKLFFLSLPPGQSKEQEKEACVSQESTERETLPRSRQFCNKCRLDLHLMSLHILPDHLIKRSFHATPSPLIGALSPIPKFFFSTASPSISDRPYPDDHSIPSLHVYSFS